MKVFVFDSSKCNGCYGCQLACKDEHCGNDWSPIALPQPDTGQFWCKMVEVTHGQIPKVRIEYTPHLCNHCDNAPCIAAAPDAVYKRDDGLVIIDPAKAKGNKALVDACPYGAIYFNDDLDVPQKCTGCAHLVDEGATPHCVDVCPTGALRFGEEADFADEIAQAETLAAASDGPRVYYINMPHLFISGDVWNPEDDEIIEGAKATLVYPDGTSLTVVTDCFGDFWFKKLDAGEYKIRVEAEGYKSAEKAVSLDKSLNVGDFALERA